MVRLVIAIPPQKLLHLRATQLATTSIGGLLAPQSSIAVFQMPFAQVMDFGCEFLDFSAAFVFATDVGVTAFLSFGLALDASSRQMGS
jgi:hypothetical protein